MATDTADHFLSICEQFKLGCLLTETQNPLTIGLAEDSRSESDIATKALPKLKSADVAALACLVPFEMTDGANPFDKGKAEPAPHKAYTLPSDISIEKSHVLATPESYKALMARIEQLSKVMHEVLVSGHCIIFIGCGATGRLSMSLAIYSSLGMLEEEFKDQIKGVISGGDIGLIRSIPKFEDRVEYGVKQLEDVGFRDGDLLVAITEGGETPFVISACEEAARISTIHRPWFLYCNPDKILCEKVERSRNIINNPKVEKINLTVGPMSVTGSTRMQATTVQTLIPGLALIHHDNPQRIGPDLVKFTTFCRNADYSQMAPFTWAEELLYRDHEFFLYEPCDALACTVMTDTTERSPTFTLPFFENFDKPEELPSQVYLHLHGCRSAHEAWFRLLRRYVQGLQWEDTRTVTGTQVVLGYDFSDRVAAKRVQRIGDASKCNYRVQVTLHSDKSAPVGSLERHHVCFSVGTDEKPGSVCVTKVALPSEWIQTPIFRRKDKTGPLDDVVRYTYEGDENKASFLFLNIFIKMLMNSHSTALMGGNHRLESNIMNCVSAGNNKLVDRSARWVTALLMPLWKKEGGGCPPFPSYEDIVRLIYEHRDKLQRGEAIVLKVRDVLLQRLK